uniref:Uncharacterized protein n=1 Tax=Anguilla anguilla TaxID=7936 RepID=A0A0E9PU28_ANGAN
MFPKSAKRSVMLFQCKMCSTKTERFVGFILRCYT